MEDPEAARILLQKVATLGVRCAIDDFGTGYSSLAYLPRFPAQTIKIDRSFVQGIAGAARREDQLLDVKQQQTLVGAIIAMAHALDRTVVAEGVETEEQMRTLVQFGCERAQGFLFAKPCRPTSWPSSCVPNGAPRGPRSPNTTDSPGGRAVRARQPAT
jgi:EAL domain-containing protein (putative c-di-GMP-specific phosphodiesterase class I)